MLNSLFSFSTFHQLVSMAADRMLSAKAPVCRRNISDIKLRHFYQYFTGNLTLFVNLTLHSFELQKPPQCSTLRMTNIVNKIG